MIGRCREVSGWNGERHLAAGLATQSRRRGFALVMVLGLMVLLAFLAAGLALTVRNEQLSSSAFADRVRARYLAYAGINRALYELSRDLPGTDGYDENWSYLDSREDGDLFADGFFLVRVEDESGKLNLNAAPDQELTNFFRVLTGDEGLAQELADSVADWRDEDNRSRTSGAEADYYASLPYRYQPRNGPLVTPSELLLIRGFTRELVYGDRQLGTPSIFNFVTVFSQSPNIDERGRPRININSATPDQLREGLSDILTESELNALIRFLQRSQQQSQTGPGGPGSGPAGGTPQRPPGPPSGSLPPGSLPSTPRPNSGSPSGTGPTVRPRAEEPTTVGNRQAPTMAPSGSVAPFGPVAAQMPEQQTMAPSPPGQPAAERRTIRSLLELSAVLPEEKLVAVWDRLTTSDREMEDGLVNLNTASVPVLSALLPNNEAAVEEILRFRQEYGSLRSVGQLLTASSLTQDQFRRIAERLCTKTATFRLKAVGVVGQFRTVATLDAVVSRRVTIRESEGGAAQGPTVSFSVRFWRER